MKMFYVYMLTIVYKLFSFLLRSFCDWAVFLSRRLTIWTIRSAFNFFIGFISGHPIKVMIIELNLFITLHPTHIHKDPAVNIPVCISLLLLRYCVSAVFENKQLNIKHETKLIKDSRLAIWSTRRAFCPYTCYRNH